MICPSCGADTPGGKAFCAKCGDALVFAREDVVEQAESEARETTRENLERRGRLWVLSALFLLVAAIFFKSINREAGLPDFREVPSLRPWVEPDVVVGACPPTAGLLPLPTVR